MKLKFECLEYLDSCKQNDSETNQTEIQSFDITFRK